jgi:transcriptional regulator with XRE-family HTH domain
MISILGINIKKIREQKNMSAYRLSKVANVGASTISQIENGNRQSLNSDTVEKIATALSVTTDALYATENDVEYIVNDIEQAEHLLLSSEELTFDDEIMTKSEKQLLKTALEIAFNSIRNQRGN